MAGKEHIAFEARMTCKLAPVEVTLEMMHIWSIATVTARDSGFIVLEK